MISLNIQIQPEILISLNKSADEFGQDLKLWAAICLYEHGKLSLAKASSLAGFHRFDFENILAGMGIPISNLTIEDIKKDIETLEALSI
jgi:predicted HTH domain antitoxin